MSLLGELQRRNVFRVGIAYVVVAWLLLQVADTVLNNIDAPSWVFQTILLVLIIGFPIAVIFAWAFEMTPEGLKKEKDVDPAESVTRGTGRKLDFVIIGLMAIALAYFAFDKFSNDVPQPVDDPVVTTVRPSIAVLPFADMSPGKDQDYFSDGISEEILNLLAKIPNLKVIARTSSFAFKGKNEDVRIIGEKLGVKTVLEGSVRTSGDRVRITAQLIDVVTGEHLWSETYDRILTDIFAVQDEVAAAIIEALQIHIGTAPTRHRPTDNMEAYTLFLKGKALLGDFQPEEAEILLRDAIEIDPEFAEAYELLANSFWARNNQSQTYDAAAKALAIDPDLVFAQALHQSAKVETYLSAVEAFERALREQPGNTAILGILSWYLMVTGYVQEALSLIERSVDLDPLSWDANHDFGRALYAAGRTSEAVAVLEITSQLGPMVTPWIMGVVDLVERQDDIAIAHFEAFLRQNDYAYSSWVRELVTAARDPKTGQAYLDRRVPEIIAAMPEQYRGNWRQRLPDLYLVFGFPDRFFELSLDLDPTESTWSVVDQIVYFGVVTRRLGFTAHPKYLELAEAMGIIKVWEKRGPPDFCEKVSGQWVCE